MIPIKQSNELIQPPCDGPKIRFRKDGVVEFEDGSALTTAADFAPVNRWRDQINAAARKHGIPPAWIAGIVLRESKGDPQYCSACTPQCCSSPAFAKACCRHGLMGLTPKQLSDFKGDVFEPALNLDLGAAVLRELADASHNCMVCVLSWYNTGDKPKCGQETSCPMPDKFNVVEECGYSEACIGYINAAILTHGYAGTPLPEASKWVWPVVLATVGVASVVGVGYLAVRDVREHNPAPKEKFWRDRARERNAGAAWFNSLDTFAKWEVGDAFVLGEFDWRDWFDKKPSRYFYDGADQARITWEISRG